MAPSTIAEGAPDTLGFSPQRLANIGPAMQQYIDDGKVPNLVTVIVRHGKIAHFDARGVMDFESNEPVDAGTLFRLYSNTKPIAGAAAMILYEAGVLSPDDPVAKFVPELADLRVDVPGSPGATEPAIRGITIRDCLTNTTSLHTAGTAPLSYRQEYREALETLGWISTDREKPAVNSRERMSAISQIPLAGHPGTRFVYHVGFPILGAVLEAASGQSMDQFFREQIFEPLGMTDSYFYLPDGALDRFPTCYVPRMENGEMRLVVTESPETSEKHLGPEINFGIGGDNGGVLSTATDYARFGQMLLNGGELDGVRILGRKTVEYMRGNHTGELAVPMPGHQSSYFALGFAVHHGQKGYPLMRSPGSYGWGGAAGTKFWVDPVEDLVGICFTQVMQHGAMPGNNYQEVFERMVYQALT